MLKALKKHNFCQKLNEIVKNESNVDFTKLGKISKVFPKEMLNEKTINDVIKYKVMEDSIQPTVESLKNEIPEIAQHVQFRNYVKNLIDEDKQEEVLRKEGLVILRNKLDPFHKYEIDVHHYKKFHDREYEVDIKEILTKDLFEKQRVVDEYVEENKKRLNDLVGYYNNKFKYTKYNKHSYMIYQNNYLKNMKNLKINVTKHFLTVSLLSSILYLTNPYLLFLLTPEYIALLYSFNLLNKLIDQIILRDDKQSVIFRTFNFLGFRKDYPKNSYKILKTFYGGKFKNEIVNLTDKGFLFTTRILRKLFSKKKSEKDLDNFKYFHIIRIEGTSFYLPADLSTQHVDTNEQLILALLNSDLKTVLEFDYSLYEDRADTLINTLENYKKELAKKSHGIYMTQEEILKQEYSKFIPNRDYTDSKHELTLKRSDDVDGTYINNGYR
jgi:hypothetical protein